MGGEMTPLQAGGGAIRPQFNPDCLEIGLRYLQQAQKPIIERLGHDRVDRANLARYATALMIEAAEFCNEVPWKSWKDGSYDRRRMIEEFADLLHFIGTWTILLEHYGITPTEIAKAFATKNQVNWERVSGLVPGYGVHTEGDSDEEE
jgi:dimeric dUTPase (all-alpha-NTP-PPase superfamily)